MIETLVSTALLLLLSVILWRTLTDWFEKSDDPFEIDKRSLWLERLRELSDDEPR